MGQTIVKNYVHIVFSTKDRVAHMQPDQAETIYGVIADICKNLDCRPIKVGGQQDHIHILCMLSKKISLVALVDEIKATSTHFIRTRSKGYSSFQWQLGYVSFSVPQKELDEAILLIESQEEIHRRKTFQEEHRAFLKLHMAEYDERYIWD